MDRKRKSVWESGGLEMTRIHPESYLLAIGIASASAGSSCLVLSKDDHHPLVMLQKNEYDYLRPTEDQQRILGEYMRFMTNEMLDHVHVKKLLQRAQGMIEKLHDTLKLTRMCRTIRDIGEEIMNPSKDRRKPILSMTREQVFLRICGEDSLMLDHTTIHFVVKRIEVGKKSSLVSSSCECLSSFL